MKSIALQVSSSSHYAGFWTLLRGFFQFQPYHGITRDAAHPKSEPKLRKDEFVFFEEEEELENYIRSFRD